MTLLGTAIVAIWNGIAPGGVDNFIEWHNREHIPERVAIPGFLRGRRYEAIHGSPAYFTLYEATDTAVLQGQPYLDRLNAPTEWTRRSTKDFTDTSRGVCETVHSSGCGDGGLLLTLRFDAGPDQQGTLRNAIRAALREIEAMPGISGVHLCIADQGASGIETAERKGRAVGVPNWIVLIEGGSTDPVDAAGETFATAMADHADAIGPVDSGLYRLQFSLSE
ncbi:hypothetical protein EMQ25_14100 [Arsenicitalea aurantiaca]|uniref:Uncharacterized protein n=1 Tax=Arsenicitalea aurantiaca TaxID=1783274 RepID=A0A433X5D1_9HYPH|nr:DUF4286 family protein [Arsenicitalea aurantiaca]RUT29257.1 hypothetical protein EMQ25_14100 [Arsenicitalea aurantiaca]